jgi:hypothetical protein
MHRIINFGIMRGGQHVYILWIINNQLDNSVLYYNNIRNIINLDDRLIFKSDTRVKDISDKLVNNSLDNHKTEIYSFESHLLNNDKIKKIEIELASSKNNYSVIIRNPYNNFASLLKYIENGGDSKYIKFLVDNEDEFINIWLSLANFIIENKCVSILFEKFISDENYRLKISKLLNLQITNNNIIQSNFGGGSSFNNKNYNKRYTEYKKNFKMIKLLNNNHIKEVWLKIQNILM